MAFTFLAAMGVAFHESQLEPHLFTVSSNCSTGGGLIDLIVMNMVGIRVCTAGLQSDDEEGRRPWRAVDPSRRCSGGRLLGGIQSGCACIGCTCAGLKHLAVTPAGRCCDVCVRAKHHMLLTRGPLRGQPEIWS